MALTRTNRNFAVDFVKFIAVLLVLNSHMGICYGSYSSLATGGGIGDALFFFISGFTLFIGRKMDWVNWCKRRIGRIYPTIFAMGMVASVFFGKDFDFLEVITAGNYWFLQCILICYLILYPIIYNGWKLNRCILISVAVVLIAYFFIYDFEGQMFYGVDNLFRWIFYFSIMLIGGWTYLNNGKIQYKKWHLPAAVMCIFLWYGINYIARGVENLAIVSMIPLVGICYFVYSIGKSSWIQHLFEHKICGNILFIMGNLCLESYMIQKYIFTDAMNSLFPLNIPIVMIMVFIAAYLLRILSSIIEQIFDSKPFDWKALFLYKTA